MVKTEKIRHKPRGLLDPNGVNSAAALRHSMLLGVRDFPLDVVLAVVDGLKRLQDCRLKFGTNPL